MPRLPDIESTRGDPLITGRRILVFDDSLEFREALGIVLEGKGWSPLAFNSPHAFFHEMCLNCTGNSCEALALISAIKKPLMLGADFVRKLKERACPIEKIALMSADPSCGAASSAEALEIDLLDKTELLESLDIWLETA